MCSCLSPGDRWGRIANLTGGTAGDGQAVFQQLRYRQKSKAAGDMFQKNREGLEHRLPVVLRDGLAAFENRIMQKHNATGPAGADQTLRHPLRLPWQPVFGIDVPANGSISKEPRVPSRSAALGTIWRPEETSPIRCNCLRARTKLAAAISPADFGKHRMVPGMVADDVLR